MRCGLLWFNFYHIRFYFCFITAILCLFVIPKISFPPFSKNYLFYIVQADDEEDRALSATSDISDDLEIGGDNEDDWKEKVDIVGQNGAQSNMYLKEEEESELESSSPEEDSRTRLVYHI